MNLWDTALDHGVCGTRAGLVILKLLCLPVLSDRTHRRCPVDGCEFIVPPTCERFTDALQDTLTKTQNTLRKLSLLSARVVSFSLMGLNIDIDIDKHHFRGNPGMPSLRSLQMTPVVYTE